MYKINISKGNDPCDILASSLKAEFSFAMTLLRKAEKNFFTKRSLYKFFTLRQKNRTYGYVEGLASSEKLCRL